ncbi:MAG TPA: ribosome biogenesis factor YjgA [Burkholderiales bacterium]|nr:ribosome biogenesis factor YjgA [Burkholderiales bacterium]
MSVWTTVNEDGVPSKTRRKQAMLALQELGAELTRLSDAQLEQVEMPDTLRDAVVEARRITRFEARRRQMQYIGRLMRDVDPAPIRAQLDVWRTATQAGTTHLHRVERWRERLLADDAALDAFRSVCPAADTQRLATLINDARRERAAGRPPKHFRALFRELKAMIDANEKTVAGQ